jgi:hypothetical protein
MPIAIPVVAIAINEPRSSIDVWCATSKGPDFITPAEATPCAARATIINAKRPYAETVVRGDASGSQQSAPAKMLAEVPRIISETIRESSGPRRRTNATAAGPLRICSKAFEEKSRKMYEVGIAVALSTSFDVIGSRGCRIVGRIGITAVSSRKSASSAKNVRDTSAACRHLCFRFHTIGISAAPTSNPEFPVMNAVALSAWADQRGKCPS